MPIFEFRCQDCREVSEIILSVEEELPRCCTMCGGKLQKLIHAPAIQFRGKGWYVTDYAKKQSLKDSSEPPVKTSDQKENKRDS